MVQKYQQELKAIESKLLVVAVLDVPGTVLTGLGIAGKFDDNPGALLAILEDPEKVNYMLAIGLAIMGFCAVRFFSLVSERARLKASQ